MKGTGFMIYKEVQGDLFEDVDVEITVYYLEKDRGIINGTN